MRRVASRPVLIALLAGIAAASPARADDAGLDAPREGSSTAPDADCGDAGVGSPVCPTYVRYMNDKFAFSVDVPAFLVRKGADADGRAQSLGYAANGKKIRVRAWAMFNAPVMTVDQLFGDWSRRGKVTYKSVAGNTWVVRGSENGQLFYMRSNLADGIITTIEAVYDPSFEEAFEPVLGRMGASLMTLPGLGMRAKNDR